MTAISFRHKEDYHRSLWMAVVVIAMNENDEASADDSLLRHGLRTFMTTVRGSTRETLEAGKFRMTFRSPEHRFCHFSRGARPEMPL